MCARIHNSPGGLLVATPHTPAVGSSTPPESPWLCWPEARGCVRVPYTHLPIAGGAKLGHAPTYRPPSWVGRGRASGSWVPRVVTSSPYTPSG